MDDERILIARHIRVFRVMRRNNVSINLGVWDNVVSQHNATFLSGYGCQKSFGPILTSLSSAGRPIRTLHVLSAAASLEDCTVREVDFSAADAGYHTTLSRQSSDKRFRRIYMMISHAKILKLNWSEPRPSSSAYRIFHFLRKTRYLQVLHLTFGRVSAELVASPALP